MTRKFHAWLNDFSDHDHGNYCARRVEQEAIYINALINAQRTAVKEASINFNRHANIYRRVPPGHSRSTQNDNN